MSSKTINHALCWETHFTAGDSSVRYVDIEDAIRLAKRIAKRSGAETCVRWFDGPGIDERLRRFVMGDHIAAYVNPTGMVDLTWLGSHLA